MQTIDLEEIVPRLREQRARERRNRAAAFAGVPWTVCGQTCVHLTPQHRLELQLAGNAFACGGSPTKADVYAFLWRVHPLFYVRWPTLRGWFARRQTVRLVRRTPVALAVREICEYIAGMLQDRSERSADAGQDDSQPREYVHWMAMDAMFYASAFGMSLVEYQKTPCLVLQQLDRAFRQRNGDANFIDESDRMVSQWLKRQSEAIRGAR